MYKVVMKRENRSVTVNKNLKLSDARDFAKYHRAMTPYCEFHVVDMVSGKIRGRY